MTTLQACLIASAAAAMVLPQVASAQSANQSYCSALSSKYQQFAGFAGSGARPANGPSSGQVNAAMEQCRNGQSAEAIPVLEAALHDANVALPPRVQPALGLAKGPSR
jgi:hypothetical protein